MNKSHAFALFAATVLAVMTVLHCATVKAVGPKVIHMAAEDCVELSSGTVKQVCATVDELAPYLDAILSARKTSAKDGGAD